MDLSIIIVNYNTKDLLRQTIDSIYKTNTPMNFEILVSDNGSTDGSVAMVREQYAGITLFDNQENLGFSKANNLAILHAQGRYILLLNSDTIIVDNCLLDCVHYLDNHPLIGALGCKVVLLDGSLDLACRRSFPTPEISLYRMTGLSKLFPRSEIFGQYNLTYKDENQTYEVDSIVGAFMMIRREVIEQVGLLDENFVMYGEDIDWCYRIKEAGWKIVYFPEAKIIHLKGASGGKKNPKMLYEFYRSMILFYKKHYANKYPFVLTALIYIGIGTKLVIALITNQVKSFFRRK